MSDKYVTRMLKYTKNLSTKTTYLAIKIVSQNLTAMFSYSYNFQGFTMDKVTSLGTLLDVLTEQNIYFG